jgi:hypothetical protein
VQEHIPAEWSEDWLFHGYCDRDGACVLAFTGRKLRAYPPDAGETAYGRAEANPALAAEATQLLTAVGYRGIMSLDYRYDRRDGRYKLLDFNPRTGAIFRLFQTDAGVDVIRALHLDMTGRPIPPGGPLDRRTAVVEGYDWRVGPPALRARARRWATADERAWSAADDIVPAAVALARAATHRFRRPFRPAPPRFLSGRAKPPARLSAVLV